MTALEGNVEITKYLMLLNGLVNRRHDMYIACFPNHVIDVKL